MALKRMGKFIRLAVCLNMSKNVCKVLGFQTSRDDLEGIRNVRLIHVSKFAPVL